MADRLLPAEAVKTFGDYLRQSLMEEGMRPFRAVGHERELDPRNSLADFIRVMFGLEPARHHLEWIAALEDEERYPRLLIVCPPGHAKTTVAGVAYPAWKIGRDVTRHWLYYGNTQTQAEKQSTAIRDIIQSEAYQRIFPEVKKSRTKGWAGNQWFLERPALWDKDATMFALGVDGPALGARADEFIFDDVCDPENMATEGQRRKVRDKVVSVAFTRQGGRSRGNVRMVAVMTRWHEEDLTSLFEAEGFRMLWMPALGYWEFVRPLGELKPSEINDIPALDQLEQGAPLWPEEYDRDYFASYQREHPEVWQLEFQGLAVKPGGTLWKAEHFRAHGIEGGATLNPLQLRGIFQFWDTASRAAKGHDFWVCQTWAWCADGYYMLEAYQGHHDFVTGIQKMRTQAERTWRWNADGVEIAIQPRAVYVEVTGTNNGQAAIDTMATERRPFYPLQAIDSKEERSGQAILQLERAPYYFPAAHDAYTGTTRLEFLQQHLAFPRAKHDDLVDATAWAVKTLAMFPVAGAAQEARPMLDSTTQAQRRAPYQTRFGAATKLRRTQRRDARIPP